MSPNPAPALSTTELIEQAHRLYCQWTGQKLPLRFDRERLWYEFLRAGFTLEDLAQVVHYLQKEIRHTRRNVGALKLSNLLQLDRFEEDLHISRIRWAPPPSPPAHPPAGPAVSPAEQARGRQRALEQLRDLKNQLRDGPL
jgi:hypothetical protein